MSPGTRKPITLTVPMLAAAAACIALLVLVITKARPLVDALMAPSADSEAMLEAVSADEAFARDMTKAHDQVVGRSMFFRPPAPPPPPPPVRDPEPRPDPGPPPKPTRYGGPEIIAMIDGHVWFDNGNILEVGGEGDGEIRVVDWSPPWSARVEWEEVEFDVELFKRTSEQYLDPVTQDEEAESADLDDQESGNQ